MHIVISIVGVIVLIAFTATTKSDWKIPVLEILMRLFYGVALITGIIVMNVHGVKVLTFIHRSTASVFIALLIGLCVHKLILNKKNK